MLRTIFVIVLLLVGWAFALKGPLYALLLYLWIAYFRPEQWAWTSFFQQLNLSYIAGIYLVLRSMLGGARFRLDLRTSLLLLFLAHSALSAASSAYSAASLGYVHEFTKTIIISYLIAILAVDYRSIRLVIIIICVSLGFEATKQGLAQLTLNPGAANTNDVPMFGDNNGVAVGMLMLVSLLVAIARTSGQRWAKWLFRLMAVSVLYRAISTYSRGGFLAAAALGLVFFVRSRRKILAVAGMVIAATITLSVLPTEFWQRMDTIRLNPGEVTEASARGRLHFWSVAWEMAADHPLLGVGHTSYNFAYDRYDFSGGAFGIKRSVHSQWFGVLAELGFVGLFLFIANIILAFRACGRARRMAKRGEISREMGELAIGVESALVVACVGGSFVIFQYIEMLWHVIGLSIAINFVVREQLAERERAASEAAAVPPPFPLRATS